MEALYPPPLLTHTYKKAKQCICKELVQRRHYIKKEPCSLVLNFLKVTFTKERKWLTNKEIEILKLMETECKIESSERIFYIFSCIYWY